MRLKNLYKWWLGRGSGLNDEQRRTVQAFYAQEREKIIQTITGSLLDGMVMGHLPNDVLNECAALFKQVLENKAGLDIDWMEGRKEFPTTRDTFRTQNARRWQENAEQEGEKEEEEWEH